MTNSDPEHGTPQEELWASSFGDDYIDRNTRQALLSSNIALFSRILQRTRDVNSVIEFGPNIGLNLEALLSLRPQIRATGVEINAAACEQLRQRLPGIELHHDSILNFESSRQYDLAFTKGLLIHINPECLTAVYEKLAMRSARYVVIAEYYNPSPVTIEYRGHQDKLFKRDFAGEFLDLNPEFSLLDYGFVWRRDANFPQDDITWFLLERD